MVAVRNPFKRQDSVDAVSTVEPALHLTSSKDVKSPIDEKDAFVNGDVKADDPADVPFDAVDEKNRLANGKERPIEVSYCLL